MIVDSMNNLSQYASVHPRFSKAFAFFQSLMDSNAADGHHVLEGTEIFEEIFVNLMSCENPVKPVATAEQHRKYIDVQILLSGDELMRIPVDSPAPSGEYNETKDCTMFEPVALERCHNLLVTEGSFVIFFAGELHAPSASVGTEPTKVRKAVIKVLAD